MKNSFDLARRIRIHCVRMTAHGASHVGSCLSISDIIAVLYSEVLRVDPSAPRAAGRDRFIVSKGHAAAAIYAVLAECGFFPVEQLSSHYRDGATLCGHVITDVPGIELSTGSLGHGLPVGVGMALSAKLDGVGHRVFVLLSDGECDEGSNWEAILFAAHHKLNNLTVIVDYNKIQSLKSVEETLALEPFADKWRSFRWELVEVDGHDHDAMRRAFDAPPSDNGMPRCILAHTTKGKGVSFMENSVLWHYRSPQGEELAAALRELGELV
ncbi:MAG: transketolase [Proteobacteria bacterium]|nr:transketolase [Pseudomonadota bacterium]